MKLRLTLPIKLTKKTVIILASLAVFCLLLFSLFLLFKPVKNFNKESGHYVGLLGKLSNPKISAEEKDEIFAKIINIYPVVRDIYAVDRAIVVEEGEDIRLPCEHQLMVARKIFIDGHLVDLNDVEDTIIPTGNKIFLKGYNIVPFRKTKVVFSGSLDLEEGRHKFRYVLDMKIVKSEKDSPGESLYETSFEYSKEFTIINKLPENYISTVNYPGLDKTIGLAVRVSSFDEEVGFDPESGLEYQKIIFNTQKESPENMALDIIAVSKGGVSLGKIGKLVIFKGEKLENYSVPLNLIKLGKGKHTIVLKFTPNKELALLNARMRKIWDGRIQTEVTFEMRKREVKSMFETPDTEKNIKIQTSTTIKREEKVKTTKTTQQPSSTMTPATKTSETLPTETLPTETQPPATQPPSTQPPATQPPATQPPPTQPPATQPPG